MDWTGGARRRFAPKKNNAVLQRQKTYFAKARAALNTTNPGHKAIQNFNNRSNPGSRGDLPSRWSVPESDIGHPWDYAKSRMSIQRHGGDEKHQSREDRPSSRMPEPELYKRRSPSVVSENLIYPERRSSTHSRQAKEWTNSHRYKTGATDTMNDEERLLLANRRRILAQGDWLGLAPTQPLRMKFSTSHDKDRVGKRRRVDSNRSKKGEPAGRRLLTPLFHERLQQHDHFMSGALPQDDFHFKIGTDALDTPTQLSNRSQTPRNTSLRQPSTDFELLSEESMLLGPDDDSFDPFQTTYESVPSGKPVGPQTQHLCEVPNMERPLGEREMDEQLEIQSVDNSLEDTAENRDGAVSYTNGWLSDDQFLREAHRTTLQERADMMPGDKQRARNDSGLYQAHETSGHGHNSAAPSSANSSQHEDDEIWRRFMNVANPESSNPSITAVKSSSLHVTASESNHRPTLVYPDESHNTPLISTPNGGGTQGLPFIGHEHTPRAHASPSLARKSPSSSPSLDQVSSHIRQPPVPAKVAQGEEDHNALWRQFVCGIPDDSDTSSQLGIASPNQDRNVENSPKLVLVSSSYMVSDLGTSNKTTIGDDTILVPRSTSTTASGRHPIPHNHDIESSEGIRSTRAQEGAGAANDNDDDSIEDDEPVAARKHELKNIHATRKSILSAKRFKTQRTRQRSPVKPVSRSSIAPRTRCEAPKQGRSVYDLVDSDGNSVV